uniref:uncharacterized protein LOC101303415 n=1 Tax=Fragaria vesca subsp. vesca TaxID=101020 RepID=UPI0005CB12BF|nr:PREDICTED: uncharacterized protein LOC101303415 [Fragaria vesca subsp. vesca]
MSPNYKVVCVTTTFFGHHEIDIYSFETQQWKKFPCVPFFSSPSDDHRHYDMKKKPMHFDDRSREGAVYCNGKVHWIRCVSYSNQIFSTSNFSVIRFEDGRFVRDEGDVLHYFDMNEQSLRLVAAATPVPEGVKSQVVHRYFGESGGHLHLIEFYKHYDTQFDIMEMEEDYSGWFLRYYVDLNRVIKPLPRTNFVVLFISRGEEKDHKVDDGDGDDSSTEADDDDDDDDESSPHLWLHVPGKGHIL